ncbi:hypothetical protein [Helicobacter canis]|uniref:Methyltransferase domain-containing protein n=1 Tax=Helicobacter canis NCTC 12740 TaxID=1357399 RepID=V8CED6_9HELI|nr:hypothetical protein [Helicobacter canis]ETD25724.1 hypothetical protein HMPREF2087_01555 [Helicobacter canis NCTC 12740]
MEKENLALGNHSTDFGNPREAIDLIKTYDRAFYGDQQAAYNSAKQVLGIMHALYKPSSVIDVGCGLGTWLKVWQELDSSVLVAGLDGNEVGESERFIPASAYAQVDLTKDYREIFGLSSELKRGGGGICKDSASGSHSADLANFGATADRKSSSTPKFAKNYESNTANLRILESCGDSQKPKSYREPLAPESAQSHDSSPNDLAMLSKPFELAQSLEVAEHLDHIFAANFVQLLTSLADVVLFSAAIPYQGGVCHINEQPPAYWAELFAKQGYVCLDFLRPSIWGDESVLWWYRQNLLVFVHKDRQAQLFPTLSPVSVPAYLPHPIIWEEKNKWLESVLNAHLHKPLSTGLKLIAKWILIKLHLLESIKRIL